MLYRLDYHGSWCNLSEWHSIVIGSPWKGIFKNSDVCTTHFMIQLISLLLFSVLKSLQLEKIDNEKVLLGYELLYIMFTVYGAIPCDSWATQWCVNPTKGLTKHLLNCYQNKFFKMKIKTKLYMLLSVIIYIISNY